MISEKSLTLDHIRKSIAGSLSVCVISASFPWNAVAGNGRTSPLNAVSSRVETITGSVSGRDSIADLAGGLNEITADFNEFSGGSAESFDSGRIPEFVSQELGRKNGAVLDADLENGQSTNFSAKKEALSGFLGALLGDKSFAPKLAQKLRQAETPEADKAADSIENLKDYRAAIQAKRKDILSSVKKLSDIEVPRYFAKYSDGLARKGGAASEDEGLRDAPAPTGKAETFHPSQLIRVNSAESTNKHSGNARSSIIPAIDHSDSDVRNYVEQALLDPELKDAHQWLQANADPAELSRQEYRYDLRPEITRVPAKPRSAQASSVDEFWGKLKTAHLETLAEIEELYEGYEIYWFARDLESLAALSAALGSDGRSSRSHLINVSRKNMRDPHLMDYLAEQGIKAGEIARGKKILFVDAGTEGTIFNEIENRLPPRARGKIHHKFLVSRNPAISSTRVSYQAFESEAVRYDADHAREFLAPYVQMARFTPTSTAFKKIQGRWVPVTPNSVADRSVVSPERTLQWMMDLRSYAAAADTQTEYARLRAIWRRFVSAKTPEAIVRALKNHLESSDSGAEGRVRDYLDYLEKEKGIKIEPAAVGLPPATGSSSNKANVIAEHPEWKPILDDPKTQIPELAKNRDYQTLLKIAQSVNDFKIDSEIVKAVRADASAESAAILQAVLDKGTIGSQFSKYILSRPEWSDRLDWIEGIIRQGAAGFAFKFYAMTQSLWPKAWIDFWNSAADLPDGPRDKFIEENRPYSGPSFLSWLYPQMQRAQNGGQALPLLQKLDSDPASRPLIRKGLVQALEELKSAEPDARITEFKDVLMYYTERKKTYKQTPLQLDQRIGITEEELKAGAYDSSVLADRLMAGVAAYETDVVVPIFAQVESYLNTHAGDKQILFLGRDFTIAYLWSKSRGILNPERLHMANISRAIMNKARTGQRKELAALLAQIGLTKEKVLRDGLVITDSSMAGKIPAVVLESLMDDMTDEEIYQLFSKSEIVYLRSSRQEELTLSDLTQKLGKNGALSKTIAQSILQRFYDKEAGAIFIPMYPISVPSGLEEFIDHQHNLIEHRLKFLRTMTGISKSGNDWSLDSQEPAKAGQRIHSLLGLYSDLTLLRTGRSFAREDLKQLEEAFHEIEAVAKNGRAAMKKWTEAENTNASERFQEMSIVKTESPEFPQELRLRGKLVARLRFVLKEGKRADTYLTDRGTALEIVKDPAKSRDLILAAWSHRAAASYGIDMPKVFQVEPTGLYLETEFIPGKSLEFMSTISENGVTPQIREQVLGDWERAKKLASERGVWFDFKSAKFQQRPNGRVTLVDFSPELGEHFGRYYLSDEGVPLDSDEFLNAFFYRDIDKQIKKLAKEGETQALEQMIETTPNLDLRETLLESLEKYAEKDPSGHGYASLIHQLRAISSSDGGALTVSKEAEQEKVRKIFAELDEVSKGGWNAMREWSKASNPEALSRFQEMHVVETGNPDLPLALRINGKLVARLKGELGEGRNARVYLTEQGTALKVIKHPKNARKLLMMAWAQPIIESYGIDSAKAFRVDPSGLFMEQEYVPGKSLESRNEGWETGPSEKILSQVKETWEKAKKLAQERGIWLDLKSANLQIREDGRITNVDYSPRLNSTYYRYFAADDGTPRSLDEFLQDFFYYDTGKKITELVADQETDSLKHFFNETRNREIRGRVLDALRKKGNSWSQSLIKEFEAEQAIVDAIPKLNRPEEKKIIEAAFREISAIAQGGVNAIRNWVQLPNEAAVDRFQRMKFVKTGDNKYPFELTLDGEVISRLERTLGSGKNSRVDLTDHGTALKVIKDPGNAKKLLLAAWAKPLISGVGIDAAELFQVEPSGLYLEQEHIPGPSLEQLASMSETGPPPEIVFQVLQDWERAKSLVADKGIWLDFKAANFQLRESGRITLVDAPPRRNSTYYRYFTTDQGLPHTREDFLDAFFYYDLGKQIKKLVEDHNYSELKDLLSQTPNLRIRQMAIEALSGDSSAGAAEVLNYLIPSAPQFAVGAIPSAPAIAPKAAAAATPPQSELRTVASDRGDIRMSAERFEDGEIKIVNLDSDKTNGSHAMISHEVKTPTDFIETLLMLENLHQYGAAEVRLNLSGWNGAPDNGLMQLLRSFADGVSVLRRDGSHLNFLPVNWNSNAAGQTVSAHVDEVLYIKDRFAGLANEVRLETGRPARQIQLRETDALGGWTAEVPQGLAGRNVILIHSNHSDASVTELLLALTALRKAGVGKINVINTYEGYARQDKVFKAGETIAASAMLKAINLLADRHFAFNPHYFDKIQNDQFHGQSIETLNGFFLIAKQMFRQLANELVPGFDSLSAADARQKLGQAVGGRMLMFVAPDDGAFGLVKAAAEWFPKWVEKKWGVKLTVRAAHFEKTRSDSKTVKLTDELWDGAGNHLRLEPGQSYPNSFAFIFDDEIARGSTILSSTYKLVRRLGLEWRHVYAGAIQGKFTAGMDPFNSGWTDEALESGAATEPKLDRVTEGEKGRMPPRMVIVSNSLKRQAEMTNSPVSLAPSIAWAMEQIEKGN